MFTLNLPLMQIHSVVRKGPLSQRDQGTGGHPHRGHPRHAPAGLTPASVTRAHRPSTAHVGKDVHRPSHVDTDTVVLCPSTGPVPSEKQAQDSNQPIQRTARHSLSVRRPVKAGATLLPLISRDFTMRATPTETQRVKQDGAPSEWEPEPPKEREGPGRRAAAGHQVAPWGAGPAACASAQRGAAGPWELWGAAAGPRALAVPAAPPGRPRKEGRLQGSGDPSQGAAARHVGHPSAPGQRRLMSWEAHGHPAHRRRPICQQGWGVGSRHWGRQGAAWPRRWDWAHLSPCFSLNKEYSGF